MFPREEAIRMMDRCSDPSGRSPSNTLWQKVAHLVKGETVVVTGQAKGRLSAINQQLSSNNIVNVISAAFICYWLRDSILWVNRFRSASCSLTIPLTWLRPKPRVRSGLPNESLGTLRALLVVSPHSVYAAGNGSELFNHDLQIIKNIPSSFHPEKAESVA
jgi:hypothetical protein